MSDIMEFVRARLGEDEQRARDCGARLSDSKLHLIGDGDTIAIDARRLLAEVEAKRSLLDVATLAAEHRHARCALGRVVYEEIVERLAQVYDWHPDYREKWRDLRLIQGGRTGAEAMAQAQDATARLERLWSQYRDSERGPGPRPPAS